MIYGWVRKACFGSFVGLTILVLAGCGSDDNGGGGGGTVTYSISGQVTLTGTQSAQVVACPPSGTTNVTIQDFSYTPSNITIGANGIVKWTNNGPSVHTVTSGTSLNPDGQFNSGDLGTGATVCVQFPAPGAYPYFCIPHPFMIGSVTVSSGLSGVTMTLSGAGSATTTTDASGNYTFAGLANGSYTVTPARTGFTFSPTSSPRTVSGANITAVNFTATPSTVITRFASLDNTQETAGVVSADSTSRIHSASTVVVFPLPTSCTKDSGCIGPPRSRKSSPAPPS